MMHLSDIKTFCAFIYTKKHKNNQKIRKSSGTVRFNSVQFETLFKFGSFAVLDSMNVLSCSICS